jgi:pimeloyl-ACP methyl ester carboxylesterase
VAPALREHLGIDRWVVVGVSWGVTRSLVYAQHHPPRVIAMVLGAVTAGTRQETDWITREMGRVFPREGEQFTGTVPTAQRGDDLSAAYAHRLADIPAVLIHGRHNGFRWWDELMDRWPAQVYLAKWWALMTYPELRYRRWAASRLRPTPESRCTWSQPRRSASA